ncbi:unnamed protein product [Brassica rapa]|uniref:Uncharacterized protein n=2 Tax=Brassica TaxID=3705 RepID=A0A8D9M7Z5_BRACM|nr:unnamed protein product [Brassica napus]CAG7900867.1 unnamed protein product [Brassica rapa]
MDTVIKESSAKETTDVNQLNMKMKSKLTLNGPVRVSEEYLSGIFESPTVLKKKYQIN